MGTLLKSEFKFSYLEGITRKYFIAWSDSVDRQELKDILVNTDLDLLQSVRNLLVHRGGIVDEKFMRRITQKSTGIVYPMFDGATVGQPLPISGPAMSGLANQSIQISAKLIRFVDGWLAARNKGGPE